MDSKERAKKVLSVTSDAELSAQLKVLGCTDSALEIYAQCSLTDDMLKTALCGDLPGHEFRGNQHTGGSGGSEQFRPGEETGFISELESYGAEDIKVDHVSSNMVDVRWKVSDKMLRNMKEAGARDADYRNYAKMSESAAKERLENSKDDWDDEVKD